MEGRARGGINMALAYYYKHEADQFSFIRIPKLMMTKELFASLSLQAKILYGLLLDRGGMARKNDWIDEEDKVYVLYQISEIMTDMNISKGKAIKALAELEKIGLVEKRLRGLGQPTLLYVKNFVVEEMSPEV